MIFHDKGFHRCDAKCGIEVIRHKDKAFDVIIATEVHDNPGTSITNMAEGIRVSPSSQLYIQSLMRRSPRTVFGYHPLAE